jgi:hypothetical protein
MQRPVRASTNSNFRGDGKAPKKRKAPARVERAGAFSCVALRPAELASYQVRVAIRPRAANKSVGGDTYPRASRYHAAMIRPTTATMANSMFLVFFPASKLSYRSTQPLKSRNQGVLSQKQAPIRLAENP